MPFVIPPEYRYLSLAAMDSMLQEIKGMRSPNEATLHTRQVISALYSACRKYPKYPLTSDDLGYLQISIDRYLKVMEAGVNAKLENWEYNSTLLPTVRQFNALICANLVTKPADLVW